MANKNKQDKKIKHSPSDIIIFYVIIPMVLIFGMVNIYNISVDIYKYNSLKKQVYNEYIENHNLNHDEYAKIWKEMDLYSEYDLHHYLYGIRLAESISMRKNRYLNNFRDDPYISYYDFYKSITIRLWEWLDYDSILINGNRLSLSYSDILEDYICNVGVIEHFYDRKYHEKVKLAKYIGSKCAISLSNNKYEELKEDDIKLILSELFYVYFDISSKFDKYKNQIELKWKYNK